MTNKNVIEYRRSNQKWTILLTLGTKDTTGRQTKQKHNTIRHEPSYKQLEVKTNHTSF